MTADALLAQRSLAEFVRQAWPVVEPGTPLVWGRHIDCICAHLEAVSGGDIRRLLINIPPGHAKSLLVSVLWPAWEWLEHPERRVLSASYGLNLATRDVVRTRSLIESDWYQQTFVPSWHLSGDQNAKTHFENDARGFRLVMSPTASTTGWRGDSQIWDDLLNVADSFSDTVRESTNRWMDLSAGNRLRDQRTGAIVMIAQRLHQNDPCGHALEQGGWEHVMLPSEYDPERKFRTCLVDSSNPRWAPFGTDWRNEPGELLHEAFFNADVIAAEKARMGPLAYAGQHAQNPRPAAGNMFKVAYFCPDETCRHFYTIPLPSESRVLEAYLSYDTATKAKTHNDYTAGCAILSCSDGYHYLEPCCLERMEIPAVVKRIALDWVACKVRWGEALRGCRIEEGAGTAVVQYLRKLMAQRREQETVPDPDWTQKEWDAVRRAPPIVILPYSSSVDKVSRAAAVVPFVSGRAVRLVEHSLAPLWIESLMSFPLADHDDPVDATVAAIEPFAGIVDVGRRMVDEDKLKKMHGKS